MLRFQPDGLLEGLLRPLILADPFGYIYFELPAPDIRFSVLTLLLAVALAWARWRRAVSATEWRTIAALAVMFYVWTFVTGNGRYFMVGLLMVGPVLVFLISRMPATLVIRGLVTLAVVVPQAIVVEGHYSPGQWAKVYWREGPGTLLPTRSSEPPAVHLTITNISYSILVPNFHSDTRWINLVGQSSITPRRWEYRRFQETLTAGLPIYVVFPAAPQTLDGTLAPEASFRQMVTSSLVPYALVADFDRCQLLSSHMSMPLFAFAQPEEPSRLAFWRCPVTHEHRTIDLAPAQTDRWSEIFEVVEHRCPKFFPPGSGEQRSAGLITLRNYPGTDSTLYVDGQGAVLFRYSRALNPTLIGSVEQVRTGTFSIPCDKLPGRYVYPWQRG